MAEDVEVRTPSQVDLAADGAAPTVTAFGQALKRALRGPDGTRPKIGALARRAGVSQSSLYAYLAGTTLPTAAGLHDILAVAAMPAARRLELTALRDLTDGGRQVERRMPAVSASGGPDELPADPGPLFGRDDVFAALDAAAALSRDRLAVLTLTGAAGVGKSAAVQSWGRRCRGDFPDGMLYVDLAGFSPGEPREPGEVLVQLLRSLGVGATEIPHRTVDRIGRFRSLVAGRRLLLVLDNARSSDQVRDLLPGATGPLVVVTSRDSLAGLVIEFGARSCPVLPLDAAASTEVLRHSAPHLADEQGILQLLARRCAGLPLALRLIGAQVAQRGDAPPGMLIHELGDGLDAFDVDSGRNSVREVLSWTEHRLPPATTRAWQLIATTPGAHCCLEGTAALLGKDLADARAEVRRLMRFHLLEVSGDGHHRMHDLVREYAIERAAAALRPAEQSAAAGRIVDWAVAAGSAAVATFFHDGAEDGGIAAAESQECPRVSTSDVQHARSWLDQHTALLIDLVRRTAADGRHADTVRLVEVIRRLVVEGLLRHRVGLEMLLTGLAAARALGDPSTAANLLRHLGWVHQMLGDGDRSAACLEEALELYRTLGDVGGEVNTLRVQASIHSMSGRLDEAFALYGRTLQLGSAPPAATATTHNNIAVCASRAGDFGTALRHARTALGLHLSLGAGHAVARTRAQLAEICLHLDDLAGAETEIDAALGWARAVGSLPVEIEALNGLGALQWARGEAAAAISSFTAALDGATELEDRYEQARACEGLAVASYAAGDVDPAITLWRRAIQHFDAIGFADADRVRTDLAVLIAAD